MTALEKLEKHRALASARVIIKGERIAHRALLLPYNEHTDRLGGVLQFKLGPALCRRALKRVRDN